ncbi:hypothetical protein [Paenibacillus woosongensis]|uniref:Uncharacterized protein n=1 Tax=Paenibacillus woosongensis TaxID=307580 RepID=A0A7X3CN41_9BACL|nr:hypothetical protein [Paenibacillus woosongensis]MUG45494.1 hypothetical protein [Paenibacillus woosongensis]
MSVVQLDLFSFKPEPQVEQRAPVLNGMYYERSTGKFVSYVQGRRYYEVTPARCLGDKAWKERIMRERSI